MFYLVLQKFITKIITVINITKKEELITFNNSHTEIENLLKCDKLVYSNITDLYQASGFKKLEISIFVN